MLLFSVIISNVHFAESYSFLYISWSQLQKLYPFLNIYLLEMKTYWNHFFRILSENEIEDIQKGAFSNLPNLEFL